MAAGQGMEALFEAGNTGAAFVDAVLSSRILQEVMSKEAVVCSTSLATGPDVRTQIADATLSLQNVSLAVLRRSHV